MSKTSRTVIWLLLLSFALGILLPHSGHAAGPKIDPKIRSIEATKQLMRIGQKGIQTKAIVKADLKDVKDREIIIKVKSGSNLDLQKLGYEIIKSSKDLKSHNIFVIKVPDKVDYDEALRTLASNPCIEYAEPNYVVKTSFEPNDEYYGMGLQWDLPKINMPKAWDIFKGNPNITVAVLDSGINYYHPDLQGRILQGYDFYRYDDYPDDESGHGTMVAGTIAANSNNSEGVAGIDWKCKILPIKAAGYDGEFSIYDIVDGIYYAIEHGADIINMSFGSQSYSDILNDALWDAYRSGILLIAASGNDDGPVSFPASCAPVIAVGATDENDNVTDFSNFGNELDITAPGENILTTNIYGDYEYASGTSFSAPIVSGIASLILGEDPDLSPQQVEWLLEKSAVMPTEPSNGQWDIFYGYGRVDAYKALTQKLPDLSADISDVWDKAKPIKLGETYQQKIELPLDSDWFKLNIYKSGYFTLNIDMPKNLAIVAGIYRYDNGDIQLQETVGDGYIGLKDHFTFYAEAGTYYFQVIDANSHWADAPYSLNVSSVLQIEAPIAQPDSGVYYKPQSISLSTSTAGANIYYTLDGSDPITAGTLYTAPIRISKSTVLKAIAVKDGYISSVSSYTYNIVDNVKRLSGSDRYKTAVAISKFGWPSGAQSVILASGQNFPDAMTGVPLAYILNCPILLVPDKDLPTEVLDEIKRLNVQNVYILGSTGVISKGIEDQLKGQYNVMRISGINRYHTAVRVGQMVRQKKTIDTVIITTGANFPDALSIGPFAAENNAPVLFSYKDKLDDYTYSALKEWDIKNAIIIGSTAVVSDAVVNELKAMNINVKRIAGLDRYTTSLAVAKYFSNNGYSGMILATGEDFPDALAGAAFAAEKNLPIILVSKKDIREEILNYIVDNSLQKKSIYVLGSEGSVSDDVINRIISQ